jgi:hypothetical protein
MRLLHFLDSTLAGAVTGLSSQRGLQLTGRYPGSPHARPPGLTHSGHPGEAGITTGSYAAILSSIRYAFFARLRRRDSHPLFKWTGTPEHLLSGPVSCSHQFAGVAGFDMG